MARKNVDKYSDCDVYYEISQFAYKYGRGEILAERLIGKYYINFECQGFDRLFMHLNSLSCEKIKCYILMLLRRMTVGASMKSFEQLAKNDVVGVLSNQTRQRLQIVQKPSKIFLDHNTIRRWRCRFSRLIKSSTYFKAIIDK